MADKNEVNPLEAGVVGAVIGAAAAAAAIALSDEKNRKKVEEVLTNLQKNGDKILEQINKKAMELKDMGSKELKSLPKPKKLAKKVASKKKA